MLKYMSSNNVFIYLLIVLLVLSAFEYFFGFVQHAQRKPQLVLLNNQNRKHLVHFNDTTSHLANMSTTLEMVIETNKTATSQYQNTRTVLPQCPSVPPYPSTLVQNYFVYSMVLNIYSMVYNYSGTSRNNEESLI